MYKWYNSYFEVFVNFVNYVIWGFLDFYIFIYYTCGALGGQEVMKMPSTISAKLAQKKEGSEDVDRERDSRAGGQEGG